MFHLKAYDLFVTNYHVTEVFRTVAIHDNERNPYLAKVVLANPAMDIALLAAEGDFSSLPDISLAEDDTLTIGRKVYVAGYPYGMPFTITEGSVSSPKQLMDGKYYIQTDAAVNPGNSGGPILDEDNRVVGVTVSKFTQADNMGFGIRVETLHALLDTIGDLDRTVFQVQCGSCEELIAQEEEYCPSWRQAARRRLERTRTVAPGRVRRIGHRTDGGSTRCWHAICHDSWLFPQGQLEITLLRQQLPVLHLADQPATQKKEGAGAGLHAERGFRPYKLGDRRPPDLHRIPHPSPTSPTNRRGDPEEHRRPGFCGPTPWTTCWWNASGANSRVLKADAVGATRQDKAMPGFP